VTMSPTLTIRNLGQSLWYDNIQRSLLISGEIKRLVDSREITGITSNPSIFEKAIAKSTDYDDAIRTLVAHTADLSADTLYETLVVDDIRQAARFLRPVYDETNAADGYVSIEVSPQLAHDTAASIDEGRRLFGMIREPNIMIKIPSTDAGLPAITALLADGIPVNVTLMFSYRDYDRVVLAFLSGIEQFHQQGGNLRRIASVASFFVSRLDAVVDPALVQRPDLLGKTAIAYSKQVYQRFKQACSTDRFRKLEKLGARRQRVLWASTSTKNPAYSDVMYVDGLIGRDTVNTVPPATLDAFRKHGTPLLTIEKDLDVANQTITDVLKAGIDLDAITAKLKVDGVKAFRDSFDSLLAALQRKISQIRSEAA